MKLKNTIINYFVVPPYDSEITTSNQPVTYRSPITINHELAREQLVGQYEKKNKKLPPGPLLHICFDLDSNIIYSPNIKDVYSPHLGAMVDAAKLRIRKDYGDYRWWNMPIRPVVEGSPFSSIRMRDISSFPYAWKFIQQHWKTNSEDGKAEVIEPMPVIEANLYLMPATVATLPALFHDVKCHGGYVNPKKCKGGSVEFYVQRSGHPVILVHRQTEPFILINISKDANISATDKERVVLFGYTDYLDEQQEMKASLELKQKKDEAVSKGIDPNTIMLPKGKKQNYEDLSEVFAAKHLLYLGWSWEDVCDVILMQIDFSSTGEMAFLNLMKFIKLLMESASQLEKEGYANPSVTHYYSTFKIPKDGFPLTFIQKYWDTTANKMKSQIPNFKVVDYNPETMFVIIETPVFLNEEICEQVLRAQNPPVTGQYNFNIKKIDVRSPTEAFDQLAQSNRGQLDKIRDFIATDLVMAKKIEAKDIPNLRYRASRGHADLNFIRRKISDYNYVTDYAKKMCDSAGIPFRDIEVIVGPIQQVLGEGKLGGFMDKLSFIENKIPMPYRLMEGLEITPPIILVDNETAPSVAAQASTLIHEYRHFINHQTSRWVRRYGEMKGNNDLMGWVQYLGDPDEKLAHKDEIKFDLITGLSVDEIIRNKVGGAITKKNFGIALLFKDLVMEATKELADEKQRLDKQKADTLKRNDEERKKFEEDAKNFADSGFDDLFGSTDEETEEGMESK